jgi:TolB-like protein/Tfp pilus assembly protein PilF
MSVIRELQRRNVIRVGAAYLAFSWLIIQIIDTLGPDFGLPGSSLRTVAIVLAIGFLPVMVFAWSFEWTAEGIKRDSDVDRNSASTIRAAKRLDRLVIVFLVLATGYFAFDKFVVAPEREAEIADQARDEGRIEGLIGSFGEQSIAVLPFDDLSAGGDQAWFADGISEELLNVLAKVEGLRVTSRSSSFAFRDQNLSVPEIAAQLDVTYVLEGSVRQAGDTIRITAQLIDGGADAHVWSETYDRNFGDVFAIQDEISAHIVDELKVTILGDLPTAVVTSKEAYELYLEGLPLLAGRDEDELAIAEDIFRRVIEMDPKYAPAHASLAASLFWQSDERKDVVAAARQALEIDPRNADALALLGRKYVDVGRTVEGEALLRRAIEFNPSHPNAWRWLGTLNTASNPAAYLRYAQRAFELHPRDPSIRFHTGLALALLGRYEEALNEFEQLAASGQERSAIAMAATVHMMSGQLERALKTQYLFYRDYHDRNSLPQYLVWLDELDLAWTWFQDRKTEHGADDIAVVYDEAFLSFFRGDKGHALQILSQALERGVFPPHEAHRGPAFVVMGGDSRVAIAELERVLTKPGQTSPEFNPYRWYESLSYAIALYRVGDKDRAEKLLADVEALLNAQIADGARVNQFQFRLHTALANIYATRGEYDRAVSALRQAAEVAGLCAPCLRTESFYKPLRDMPEFQQLVVEVERRAAEQSQRLAEEGMLLTPEEVLALENFEYDPFTP